MTGLLPESNYPAVCISADLGYTRGNKECLVLQFELTDPDRPGFGMRLSKSLLFAPENLPHTVKALRALGFPPEESDITKTHLLLFENSGIHVELKIEQREWDGKMVNNVAFINVPGGGGGVRDPMSEDQKTDFRERMRGQLLNEQQILGSEAKPAQGERTRPGPADETGFTPF